MSCRSLAWRILSITLLAFESEVAQLCLTLCDPMDYSLPGSSIHGILQARVLDWGAIAFSIILPEGMATHSRILAWEIHGQRNLAGDSP